MAVAAYASLVSLTHVLDNLHYRSSLHLPPLDVNLIQTLQQNTHFLLGFVERHSRCQSSKKKRLWRMISEVAFEVEDKIDYHVVNLLKVRSLQGDTSDADSKHFHQDMAKLISEIDFIKRELSVAEAEGDYVAPVKMHPASHVPTGGLFAACKDIVVGIEDRVIRVIDELTKGHSKLQILPIVGMGGIGKTTLAKAVFDHQHVANYFDMHIWFSISQEYSVEQILKGLIDDSGSKRVTSESREELGERLYKTLFGRRYLIVMDDVWETQAWDDFKRFFPNNDNGSRILLTTRLLDVASSLGSHNTYSMPFLDEGKSWDLFCQNTFGRVGCPIVELEEIGKDIVKGCRGLPLEIVVISRLLANSDMTCEYWSDVAKNISSFGNLAVDEHCFKVLSLSYTSLPIHLKPCFLYMRGFPEDERIGIVRLIRLWVDEGFIKSDGVRRLEEIAEEYLNNLIGRNLIYVSEWTEVRKIKNCGIHDLLRDLCLRESDKEHFIFSPKVQYVNLCLGVTFPCFLCSKPATEKSSKNFFTSPSLFHDNWLLCHSCETNKSSVRSVRVLDGRFNFVSRALVQPTKLRSLYFLPETEFLKIVSCPPVLNLLWTLQTIYIHVPSIDLIEIPVDVWEMPQLRHLQVRNAILPDPPAVTRTKRKEHIILRNLQSFFGGTNFDFSKDVVARIPNLNELCISYDVTKEGITGPTHPFHNVAAKLEKHGKLIVAMDSFHNVAKLEKLEKLILDLAGRKVSFPSLANSLKKLHIRSAKIPWKEMTVIGSLPNLEDLNLSAATEGHEWNPIEGEFLQLKMLMICTDELVCWTADAVHFPNLEWLSLMHLMSLEEIPLGIGDIAMLHTIQIAHCSDSAVNSAERIWEEQQSMGNMDLQIHLTNEQGRLVKWSAQGQAITERR